MTRHLREVSEDFYIQKNERGEEERGRKGEKERVRKGEEKNGRRGDKDKKKVVR